MQLVQSQMYHNLTRHVNQTLTIMLMTFGLWSQHHQRKQKTTKIKQTTVKNQTFPEFYTAIAGKFCHSLLNLEFNLFSGTTFLSRLDVAMLV